MIAIGFLLVALVSMGAGIGIGVGLMYQRIRSAERELELIEKAKWEAKIDTLGAKVRPQLEPPSDYFRGGS